jgi:hypothetical protein
MFLLFSNLYINLLQANFAQTMHSTVNAAAALLLKE